MKLIILYGSLSNSKNGKVQNLIDGNLTCGYRDYAEKFGCIVYPTPQNVRLPWEHSIYNSDDLIEFVHQYPDAVVWSVKHDPAKDDVLRRIKNRKAYYSCCSRNVINTACDYSLIDTEERLKQYGGNGRLYVKGKNKDFWKPVANHDEYDYVMVGKRGDKNELHFIQQLNKVSEPRRVLWVGGEAYKGKVGSNHHVDYTAPCNPSTVRDSISKAKVGVLFTELAAEGFPQTFLEMTMCGVPVVYNVNAPRNPAYFHQENSRLTKKKNLLSEAENLLATADNQKCRDIAVENYSLEQSLKRSFYK